MSCALLVAWSLSFALSPSVIAWAGGVVHRIATLRLFATRRCAVRLERPTPCKTDESWAIVAYSVAGARSASHIVPMSNPGQKHGPAQRWRDLPRELLLPIARLQSTGPELLNLALVCKAYRSEIDSEPIWHQLCVQKFGVDPTASPPCWKDLYRHAHKFNHELLYGHVLHATVNVLRDLRLQHGVPLRLQLPMHA